MSSAVESCDVVVVGGGVGGLSAAAYLGRAGQSVVLFEKASAVGGRAVTHTLGECLFNLGPHALYRQGPASEVLRDLGVSFKGGLPSPSGAYAVKDGKKHALPGGLISLLTTGLFGISAKLETARLLAGIARIDTHPLQRVTVREWLETAIRTIEVRQLVGALFRLASYTNAPETMSAGAAVAQLQSALSGNVSYLDGGWQTLVDGLRAAAEGAGVRIVSSARVARVQVEDNGCRVELADGTGICAASVVLAIPPAAAAEVVDGGLRDTLRGWADAAVPVRAACLDVALSRLPEPRATFALGIDRPLYLSVHSAFARLAPQGKAVVQVAKYLGTETTDPKSDERELEGLLDLVQPGWRDAVIERRFLPNMVVTNAIVTAARGGLADRPGPAVSGSERLFVVGDWVGPQGMLADTSLASARQAAQMISKRAERKVTMAA